MSLTLLTFWSTILLGFLISITHAGNWNTGVQTLVTERLDPIVSPNAVAGHMHSVVGGSAFAAAYNYQDQLKSTCTSFPISVDRSNYWHPKLYWINNNGTSFTPLAQGNRVYYFREKSSPNDHVQPFPEGLRMIVGDPSSKIANNLSFSFLCRTSSVFDGPGDIWSSDFNFERDCPNDLLVQHKFPPCWDGVNLYKSDQSHMAYPQYGTFWGACPSSHPIRLPGIMFEAYFSTSNWAAGVPLKGHLAWANGDTTGYGVHADFTNGWDTNILARALNDTVCGVAADMTFQECPVFQPYITSATCSPDKGQLVETTSYKDMVPVSALPGCNPLWSSGSKPTCSGSVAQPDVTKLTGTDGSKLASKPQNLVLPTTPGWKAISCIGDSNNMLVNQIRYYDPNVTQTSCLDSCLRSGYSYASIGFSWGQSWTCDCGSAIDPIAPVTPGSCNMTCPSNSSQICGGSGAHSIFYAPTGTAPTGDYASNWGCYANPPAGKVGLENRASYDFTSWNLMTRELCGQACANRGLSWAAIQGGSTCFCGAQNDFSLGNGSFVSDSLCTSKCVGNSSQTCGYWGGLSLFNVTASGYAQQTLDKPDGYLKCYADGTRTSLNGAQYYDGTLTPQKCQYGCVELGYSLASTWNGNMCFCGNAFLGGATLPTSMCSTNCSGNTATSKANYTCGGPSNGELYNTSSLIPTVTAAKNARSAGWQGCFPNPSNNFTADFRVSDGKLTVDNCVGACNELGYPWAAVQNGWQCQCTKNDPHGTIKPVASNTYCTVPCVGDATKTCGGWGYVDLYSSGSIATNGSATSPTNKTIDTGVPQLPGYIGCYNGSSPLPAYKWWSANMTVQLCTKGCKEIGSPLSALNAGTCSCGTPWTGGPQLSSLSCGVTCGGDSSQKCGGWPGQSSLYKSSAGPDTPASSGYQGCWSETATSRSLTGYTVWLDDMSVDNCRAICSAKSFLLAGVENVKRCSCGNTSAAVIRQPSQFCATPCPGNPSQMCGQYNRIAIYQVSPAVSASVSSASGTKSSVVPSSLQSATSTLKSSSAGAVLSSSSPSTFKSSVSASKSIVSTALSSSVLTIISSGTGVAKSVSASSLAVLQTSSTSPIQLVATSGSIKSTSSVTSRAATASSSMTGSISSLRGSNSISVTTVSHQSAAASPSPAVTSSGCFADLNSFNGSTYSSGYMTNDICVFWCKARSFTYAAVSSNKCMCGNTAPTVAAAGCSTTCSSNSSQVCGGTGVGNVFITSSTISFSDPYITSNSSGYLGCWTDSSTRLLPSYSFTSSSLTIGSCSEACKAKGYKYAGAETGNECYCANSLSTTSHNYRVPDSECNNHCRGDTSANCGGTWRLSVFMASANANIPSSSIGTSSSATLTILPSSVVSTPSTSTSIISSSATACRRSSTQNLSVTSAGPSVTKSSFIASM